MFQMILDRMKWMDEKAFYLHNFVFREDIKNGDALFLEYAEQYVRKQNVDYFKLDSAQDNISLTSR